MPDDGLNFSGSLPGAPPPVVPPAAPPSVVSGEVIDDGLVFGGYPQPPSVPPDPTDEDWRGEQGEAGPPGPTGATGAAGAPGAPGAARNYAKLQAQWVSGATVANGTVYLAYDAPYTGTINSLTRFTGSGSFTAAIQINGVSVTGLGAAVVNSATPSTTNATAANTFGAGARITAAITAATGSPTDALLSLAVTWN